MKVQEWCLVQSKNIQFRKTNCDDIFSPIIDDCLQITFVLITVKTFIDLCNLLYSFLSADQENRIHSNGLFQREKQLEIFCDQSSRDLSLDLPGLITKDLPVITPSAIFYFDNPLLHFIHSIFMQNAYHDFSEFHRLASTLNLL